MRGMNESSIIAEVQRGGTDEFGLLYDAYFDRIYSYIFYRTRDKALTEDLVSATFLKAVANIGRFKEDKGNFSAWLYRIARNTLFDHYRSKKNASSIEDVQDFLFSDERIENETADRELIRTVKDLFGHLTPEQREIVTMRIWDDLSYAEIASITGKTESACKVTFSRAIAKLRGLAPLAIVLCILFAKYPHA